MDGPGARWAGTEFRFPGKLIANSFPTEFFVIDTPSTPTHSSAVPKFSNLRICPDGLAFSTLVVLPPAQSPCGCVLLLG